MVDAFLGNHNVQVLYQAEALFEVTHGYKPRAWAQLKIYKLWEEGEADPQAIVDAFSEKEIYYYEAESYLAGRWTGLKNTAMLKLAILKRRYMGAKQAILDMSDRTIMGSQDPADDGYWPVEHSDKSVP